MYIILICIGMVLAALLALQDFRERLVSIWSLAGLALAGFQFQFEKASWLGVQTCLGNLAIILFLWGSVWVILRWKGYRNIMDSALGWGDIAMLAALSGWFPPEIYVLFLCIVFTVSASGYFLALRCKRISHTYPVPLAGLLGLGFLAMLPLYVWSWQTGCPSLCGLPLVLL
ncbi:MAG: prepilin peptidase [Bacteroidota bacterium]